jgi:EpsI family protein
MTRRVLTIAVLLVITSAYLARMSKAEPVPLRESLSSLPYDIGGWQGTREPDFDDKILHVLGVDDYTRRTYRLSGQGWIGLYIGYYQSQRQGDTVHSPLNCLPGAGWTPVIQERTTLMVRDNAASSSGRQITINQFVIEKGLDRQLVFYWYQSHGRVIASEYWGRIFTVADAIRRNRTDAALVRVVVPILGDENEDVLAARRRGAAFVEALFPYLGRYLPS